MLALGAPRPLKQDEEEQQRRRRNGGEQLDRHHERAGEDRHGRCVLAGPGAYHGPVSVGEPHRPDPLVSVVMAAYNGAEYIGDAARSVLAQTHRRLELIVVDDCSTDATAEIVEAIGQAEGDRVTVLRRPINEGPCRARSVGFACASGELVCWIDQDDLWLPTKVEEQVAVMRARPEVGLVYTYFEAFDGDSGATIPWPDGRRDYEGDVLGPLFVEGCFIGSVTTMIRRAALETRSLRIRDTDFSFGDDYYLWLGIALDWQVARIPRVLARYRRHGTNESARLERRNVDLWRVRLLREFLAEYPDAHRRLGWQRRTALARHYLLAAGHARRQGLLRESVKMGLRSVAADPLMPLRRAGNAVRRPGREAAATIATAVQHDAIRDAVLQRAPLLTTAAWWYGTLRKQAREMRRAGVDPRSPAELLADVPPGATILAIDGHHLLDPRATVEPVRAIQRREELLELLERVRALEPRYVCEIGTAAGGTLYFLTRVAHESALIVSIDVATPLHTRFARRKLARGSQRIVSLEGDSQAAGTAQRLREQLGHAGLDFLFIDGDHSYEGVRRDFELYAPLVRPGGLIALHDINPDSGDPTGPISGEVPRAWAELRRSYRTDEIVHAPPGEGLGIGLVHV